MNNSMDKKYFGIDLKDCKFIGKGRQGSVYLLPDKKRIIKIYNKEKGCKGEAEILLKVQNDPHFAKIYDYTNKAMIREYIPGECIKDYIRKHGLSRELAINLVKLVESFKADGFKKLDIRLAHVYVQTDGDVRVIDPRKVFERSLSYPRSIFKDLKKLSVLSKFMRIVQEDYPDLYKQWNKRRK
ncbi:serine/threonine protein kinase [Clostridium sp. P21]|uniref:Serine/threonine protein kinase n=1 Tax=Clostridium muellerianum TaxID=2716538 RepID=A0A7Y0EJQ5_9CLOT|nr:serine/threonine protein kinase [Clostridium muellerianum]NMM64736.1 serine/threonine protein kinase [Clostridium muellerianum]